ncbi:hypothetical protein [Sphingobacterium lumbrici]|uniref:hypothetical protein n=1 Tax=Sphingobacterium lumbrici TaxID=2559600 RepID=UPI0011277343|nr:hypothetical protein [Sphingobacterium lumbrici]
MKKKNANRTQQPEFSRPVEKYFYELDNTFASGNKRLYAVCLAFPFFGVMGLIWMVPFPQFDFLVKLNMHTFLNWGSFFIAITIYLYLKLSPTLSYAILFSIAAMSFFIVQLEYVERDGGPSVVLVCTLISVISLLALWVLAKRESKPVNGNDFIKLLTVGPIWLWSKVFDKLKIKY